MPQSCLALTVVATLLAAPALALGEELVGNSADIVKAANWEQMETLTIELDDFSFSPPTLTLKAGQPYRLVVKNVGKLDHYYTAPAFFRSVAWRKVQTPKPNGGEIKAPYFTAVEAYKDGGIVELFFVTVNKGTFEVECTIEGHRLKGMHGTIIVE